jgi:hypothetical protein
VQAERENQTAQFERLAQRSLRTTLVTIPVALLALIDLLTGWPIGGIWEIDVALLVAVGMGIWGSWSLDRFARRMRKSQLPTEMTPLLLARTLFSIAATVALTGGIGYLLAGWIGAAALLALEGITTGVGVAIGLRRRKAKGGGSS